MAPNKIADLILQKWIASLKTRDRSKNAMASNFDDLFLDFKTANIPFDDAHDLLSVAIKAHLPNKSVLKNTWNKNRSLHNIFANQAEFLAEWNDSISAAATDAFFSNYPLKMNDDDDGEPKTYGSMSAREYRRQRTYSDSFPTLNTDELERQLEERVSLADELDNVLGDKK